MEFGHPAGHHQCLTLDVAYVGNHGFQEESTLTLTSRRLALGGTVLRSPTCRQPRALTTHVCKPDAAAEVGGQYSAQFPYLSNIDWATNGGSSPTTTPCR